MSISGSKTTGQCRLKEAPRDIEGRGKGKDQKGDLGGLGEGRGGGVLRKIEGGRGGEGKGVKKTKCVSVRGGECVCCSV